MSPFIEPTNVNPASDWSGSIGLASWIRLYRTVSIEALLKTRRIGIEVREDLLNCIATEKNQHRIRVTNGCVKLPRR